MNKGLCVGGACALAVIAAGCGTTVIDAGKVEQRIRTDASGPPYNLSVGSVRCPSKRPAKKDETFQCMMTLSDGETVMFKIQPTDSGGHVLIRLENEIASFVQATIDRRLRQQGIKATSTCPQHVPIVPGTKFTCSIASARGKHTKIRVTITDSLGSFQTGAVRFG